MAGSEKSGFANAKAILIENAYFVLTPSEKVLKAIPIIMNAKEHDFVTGTISHVPHIIASGLVNFVEQTDTANEYMKLLAAGGFKDITRIASSSPTMWQHICLKNHKQISEILDAYIHLLIETKKSVETCNTEQLYDFFDRANNYRNSIPDSSFGCIKKEFVIYCDIIDEAGCHESLWQDIIDEAGGIATIATILASNHISIKNIGIIHNREFEEGVLRIVFYEELSSQKAVKLLQKYRYIVYER